MYDGKIALVTGARRGVGQIVAAHFLKHGAQVVGFSRHDDEAEPRPGYFPMAVDVSDADSVARGFEFVRKQFGRVDIVVNSAAVLTSQYSMVMPAQAARAMLDTNVMGSFLVSREAAKLMRRNKWGRIIQVSSMAAVLEPMGDAMYAATKAAVESFSRVMAKEFAAMNVTCNTLGITAIETDMLAKLPRDKVDALIQALPVPRYATAEDVLNVIDFFASERSASITAQTVYLGGVS